MAKFLKYACHSENWALAIAAILSESRRKVIAGIVLAGGGFRTVSKHLDAVARSATQKAASEAPKRLYSDRTLSNSLRPFGLLPEANIKALGAAMEAISASPKRINCLHSVRSSGSS